MRNKIAWWLLSKIVSPKYVKSILEVSMLYATYRWAINHPNTAYTNGYGYNKDFCDIQFAFIDGYNKALWDNNLKLDEGKVVEKLEDYLIPPPEQL